MKKNLIELLVVICSASSVIAADSLLDTVLDSPTNALESGFAKTGGKENSSRALEMNEVRQLRAEVTKLRKALDRKTSEIEDGGHVSAFTQSPLRHIENPSTLFIRGGGAKFVGMGSVEWTSPIINSDFTLSIRGFWIEMKEKHQIGYSEWDSWSRENHYYISYNGKFVQDNVGGELLGIWKPFRGKILSPFAGIGLRYEVANVEALYDESGAPSDGGGISIAGRLGLLLDFKRVFIIGEYIIGGDSSELIGDVSFYLTRRMKLHAFAENIDMDLCRGIAYGGGLSFDF